MDVNSDQADQALVEKILQDLEQRIDAMLENHTYAEGVLSAQADTLREQQVRQAQLEEKTARACQLLDESISAIRQMIEPKS